MSVFVYLLGMFITIMVGGVIHAVDHKEFDVDPEFLSVTALGALLWPVVLAFGLLLLFLIGPFFIGYSIGYSLYKKFTTQEK